jgi:hypothetical protein
MARQYLYAVTRAGFAPASPLAGIQGLPVESIEEGPLAALASPLNEGRVRPERKILMAHQEVLKLVLRQQTLLPMTFGTISNGPQATREMLARHAESFLSQLERVDGCVEMGLRLSWNVPNIFEYFVTRHSELRELRDKIRDSEAGGGAHAPLRLELGRLFERVREAERREIDDRLTPAFAGLAREIHRAPCRAENDILNWSCLVPRELEDAFGASVVQAAAGFNEHFAFDYNGPWAPHHFVDLSISPQAA